MYKGDRMIVAVNEIAKHPKIISDADEIIYVQDKRKNELKSIVIPASYEPYLHDVKRTAKIGTKRYKERVVF